MSRGGADARRRVWRVDQQSVSEQVVFRARKTSGRREMLASLRLVIPVRHSIGGVGQALTDQGQQPTLGRVWSAGLGGGPEA